MTALKIYRQCRIAPWSAKSLLRRHVDNNVDISEQFIGYTWCEVRISRDKGCFAGRQAERDQSKFCGMKWINWFGLFICIVVPYGFGCSTALHYFRLQCCVQYDSNTFSLLSLLVYK